MPGPRSGGAGADWIGSGLLEPTSELFHLGPGVRRDERIRGGTMNRFDYHRPTSVDAAVAARAAAADGTYLAGGMTLIPTLKQGLAQPSDLVDLGAIGGLSGIR